MTLCWIILIIGISMFILGGIKKDDEVASLGGFITILILGFGFLLYGCIDSVRSETSIVPISEIVRTKKSIMVRPDEKDSEFISSSDFSICSAKDKDIYLLRRKQINHYGGEAETKIEICIHEEKETQLLEKKE